MVRSRGDSLGALSISACCRDLGFRELEFAGCLLKIQLGASEILARDLLLVSCVPDGPHLLGRQPPEVRIGHEPRVFVMSATGEHQERAERNQGPASHVVSLPRPVHGACGGRPSSASHRAE
jgi:hypothetical protein